jgi:hypothetical protein
MKGLPTPPDAYWAVVPWWGYLSFVLVAIFVMFVLAPWALQRARNRTSAMLSREQLIEAQYARSDERREREIARLEANISKLEEDRDRGWGLYRGWVAVAHPLWHECCNAVSVANGLLLLIQRVLDGKVPNDAARDRIADHQPLPRPAPLPDPDRVDPKQPGETKYT